MCLYAQWFWVGGSEAFSKLQEKTGWKECLACREIQVVFVNANRKQTWQGTGTASYVFKILPHLRHSLTDNVFKWAQSTAASCSKAVDGPQLSKTSGYKPIKKKKQKKNPHMDKTRESVWYERLVFPHKQGHHSHDSLQRKWITAIDSFLSVTCLRSIPASIRVCPELFDFN